LSKTKTFLQIALSALKEKGIGFFLNRFFDYSVSIFTWQYYKRFPPQQTFTLRNKTYCYFYNLYNITWKNERAVEIPVVWDAVQSNANRRILEVGNVLSWYFPIQHDVLDKYEITEGVINEDIVDFKPPENYDLIVSISTVEHIGWDETPREPAKILRAVEHLKTLLASGGQLLITAPLGYNKALDEYLQNGSFGFAKTLFLIRHSKKTDWLEIDEKTAYELIRSHPYRTPEVVLIAAYERP